MDSPSAKSERHSGFLIQSRPEPAPLLLLVLSIKEEIEETEAFHLATLNKCPFSIVRRWAFETRLKSLLI